MKKSLMRVAGILVIGIVVWGVKRWYDQMKVTPPTQTPSATSQQVASGIVSFEGKGTEPFRSFSYSGSMLTWTAPSNTGGSFIVDTIYTGITETQTGTSFILNSPTINVVIVPGTCSDGMSENTYSYSVGVTLTTGPVLLYNGCGNGIIN